MIPHHFDYVAPASAQEAVATLAAAPHETRVFGGGTWLIVELGRGLTRARTLIDLRRAGLGEISERDGIVSVGATCTYADLLAHATVSEHLRLLALMAAGVTGGRAIVGQGTLGGSAAAARPQSDAPGALAALGGEAVALGAGGERRIPTRSLIEGPMRSALAPGEILVRFELPSIAGRAVGYHKLKLGESSWPIATAAAVLELDRAGAAVGGVLTLGALSERPLSVELADLLDGATLERSGIERCARLAVERVERFWGDVLAPASYRRAVAAPVAQRALAMALAEGSAV